MHVEKVMHLKEIQQAAFDLAKAKRLHENLALIPLREQTLVRLALVHTEVSEAAQIIKRHGIQRDGDERTTQEFCIELADIVIRVCELAEHFALDLDAAVYDKLGKNWLRPPFYGTPWEGTDA